VGKEDLPHPLQPEEAGRWVLNEIGLAGGGPAAGEGYAGPIRDVEEPAFRLADHGGTSVLALVAADAAGRLRPTAAAVVQAACLLAQDEDEPAATLVALTVPEDEGAQRQALGQLLAGYAGDVVLIAPGADAAGDGQRRLLEECLQSPRVRPLAVVGEPWAEPLFARLGSRADRPAGVVTRVHYLGEEGGRLVLETALGRSRLRLRQTRTLETGHTLWIALAEDAQVAKFEASAPPRPPRIERWTPRPGPHETAADLRRLLDEVKQDAGLVSLADADFIIDVGFGVGSRDGYEAVIEPLERALRDLGVRRLAVGGSRKVTEELHLLPADRQIGQSGVSVNPQVILAIGISGAPQHLNYIGPRARILAFNRDPQAPLLTLNQRQPVPKVYPVVGDLFATVPALIAALGQEKASG
jgi:hypothetical protein